MKYFIFQHKYINIKINISKKLENYIIKNLYTLAATTDLGSKAQSDIIFKISTTSWSKQWALKYAVSLF